MNEHDSSLHREEVSRLNRIIEALLFQSEMLRVENKALRTLLQERDADKSLSPNLTRENRSDSPVHEIGTQAIQVDYSHTEPRTEINHLDYSQTETGIGVSHSDNSQPESRTEINQMDNSQLESRTGVIQMDRSQSEVGIGVNQMYHPETETRLGVSQASHPNLGTSIQANQVALRLPPFIEATRANAFKIKSMLMQGRISGLTAEGAHNVWKICEGRLPPNFQRSTELPN